jgi:hypothetical protein
MKMSDIEMVEVTCLACNQPAQTTMWTSINVNIDPDLREQLLNGELFDFHCEHCGGITRLIYPFLYHDMANRFWIRIVFEPQDDQEYITSQPGFMAQLMMGYRSRLVASLEEMKDKIQILEAGLDDRVVEVMKLYFKIKFSEAGRPVGEGPWFFYGLEKDGQDQASSIYLGYPTEDGSQAYQLDFEYYDSLKKLCTTGLGLPEEEHFGWLRVDENFAQQTMASGDQSV